MKKRNNNFDLSGEEVVDEFMKGYGSHSRSRHHHSHSSHHHSSREKGTHNGSGSEHHHHHHHHSHNDKNKKKKIPLILKILIIIVALIFFVGIVCVSGYFIARKIGENSLNGNKEDVTISTHDNAISYDDSGKTVEYKGQKYVYNEDIVTGVFLGIDDKSVSVNITDEYGTAGQADTIMVFAYDTKTGDVSIITVPRDSMVDVDVYSESGNFARTEEMQICLAFAYGDGGEGSCENTIKSIERVLMGIPIDSYFSLRVRGVDALNAVIGGVELTCLETVGQFVKGEKMLLQGTQARFYVTSRDRNKIDSDALRRERQIQYVKAFAAKTMSLAKKDIGIISKLYNTAKQYTVTDINFNSAVYLGTELVTKSAKISKVTALPGKYVETDNFPAYVLDNELVYETILDTFYKKVN